MAQRYPTVQAGSGIIASASGTTVIVDAGTEDQFGEGATLIVWPSGKNLDANVRNYETMTVASKSGNTLTVARGSEEDPTGLATFAEGDQVALSFPEIRALPKKQTQVITAGKTNGFGPTIDFGVDAFAVFALVTATIKDVNLDGGTPGSLGITIVAAPSMNGSDWGTTVVTTSGEYPNADWLVCTFHLDDPTPLYQLISMGRYMRFRWEWYSPSDIGVNASATITFELEYL